MHRISQETADLWEMAPRPAAGKAAGRGNGREKKPGSCRVGFLDKDYSAKA